MGANSFLLGQIHFQKGDGVQECKQEDRKVISPVKMEEILPCVSGFLTIKAIKICNDNTRQGANGGRFQKNMGVRSSELR